MIVIGKNNLKHYNILSDKHCIYYGNAVLITWVIIHTVKIILFFIVANE